MVITLLLVLLGVDLGALLFKPIQPGRDQGLGQDGLGQGGGGGNLGGLHPLALVPTEAAGRAALLAIGPRALVMAMG